MKVIKELVDVFISNKTGKNEDDIRYLDFCGLEKIPEDNPWKMYEGCTPKEFIQKNFADLEKQLTVFKGLFTDFLASVILEVAFVKIHIEPYNKIYIKDEWVAIYYFDSFEDADNICYAIGGEPLLRIEFPQEFKDRGWENYPELFLEFWKIHSFFKISHDEISEYFNFDLDSITLMLSNGFDEIIKHPAFFNKKDVRDDIFAGDDMFDKDHFNPPSLPTITNFDSDLKDDNFFYNDSHKDYFLLSVENSIPIKYHADGNHDFLIKNKNNVTCCFFYNHDGTSDIYLSLEHYLFGNLSNNLSLYKNKINGYLKYYEGYYESFVTQTEFTYSHLDLKELPNFLLKYNDLEVIDVSHSKIQILPQWITNFKKLKDLNISDNELREVNIDFSLFKQLKIINISGNNDLYFKNIHKSIYAIEADVYFTGIADVFKDSKCDYNWHYYIDKYFTSKSMLDVNFCCNNDREILQVKLNIVEKRLKLYKDDWYSYYLMANYLIKIKEDHKKTLKYLMWAYDFQSKNDDSKSYFLLRDLTEIHLYKNKIYNPQLAEKYFLELFDNYTISSDHDSWLAERYRLYGILLANDFENRKEEALKAYQKALELLGDDGFNDEKENIQSKIQALRLV